jgi:hypothetical protein
MVSSEEKKLQMSPKGSFVANTIAYIFHPVFIPTYMALSLYFIMPQVFQGIESRILGSWIGNIVLNTLFFPLLAMLLLKALGFISSFQLNTRNERIIPLIASMIFYFWAWQVFRNVNIPFFGNHRFVYRYYLFQNQYACRWHGSCNGICQYYTLYRTYSYGFDFCRLINLAFERRSVLESIQNKSPPTY